MLISMLISISINIFMLILTSIKLINKINGLISCLVSSDIPIQIFLFRYPYSDIPIQISPIPYILIRKSQFIHQGDPHIYFIKEWTPLGSSIKTRWVYYLIGGFLVEKNMSVIKYRVLQSI